MEQEGQSIDTQLIDPRGLFEDVAEELRDHGLRHFHVLTPDKRGRMTPAYASERSSLCLSSGEAHVFAQSDEGGVWLVPDGLFFRRSIIFLLLRWKLRRHQIRAVMPVLHNQKVVCLLLLGDEQVTTWQNSLPDYMQAIHQDLTSCLQSIMHYNQTMEWLQGYVAKSPKSS